MDLIGKQFTELKVLKLCEERIKGKKQYLCLCSCGKETVKTRNVLVTGNSKSCGHTKFTFNKDEYINKKYNQLTCIEYSHYGDGITGHFFKFKCDCNEEIILPINNVKSGNTKHCGCKYKIEIGTKFGELTVIDTAPKNEFGHLQFVVECGCGNRKIMTRSHLITAKTCGNEHVNIMGKVFGRLTVISRSENINDDGKYGFICKCECGNTTEVAKNNLISGRTRSCNCLNSELAKERHRDYRISQGCDPDIRMEKPIQELRKNTYKIIRHLITELDNEECVICKSKIDLHIHHIEPLNIFLNLNDKSTYYKLYNIENLVTLCINCHEKAHNNYWNGLDKNIQTTLINYRNNNNDMQKIKDRYTILKKDIISFIDNFNYELIEIL